MQYTNLGSSGLKVSRIILGCMSLRQDKPTEGFINAQWALDEEESHRALHHAYFTLGINTFDTANAYSGGQSERVIGSFIKKHNIPREEVVIMTKVFLPVETFGTNKPPKPNTSGLSRKAILASVAASLERLGVEYIDVLQIHRFDTNTPIEETMEALHDVIKAGKVRYIGASSMYAWQFAKMQHVAEKRGWTKFISMQNLWNLLYREEEREMVPFCKDSGVALIPWGPLAQGVLARPVSDTADKSKRGGMDYVSQYSDPENKSRLAVRKAVESVAKRLNATTGQVAAAWLLHKGANPIIGATRKHEQLEEIVKAIDIKLSPEDVKELEKDYSAQEIIGWLSS